MMIDESGPITEFGTGSQPGGQASGQPESEIEKLVTQGADLLALFQQSYEIVFKCLRDERNFRQGRKRAALPESEIDYWQGRIDNAQGAIDALIRMKDLGKIGLMRVQSPAPEYEQLTLISGPMGPGKMGF